MRAAVFATKQYEREAKRPLTEAEIEAMETSIAADPEAHPIVIGTGGVRKARWRRQGKGKSGGVPSHLLLLERRQRSVHAVRVREERASEFGRRWAQSGEEICGGTETCQRKARLSRE